MSTNIDTELYTRKSINASDTTQVDSAVTLDFGHTLELLEISGER
jgi:hypothetical protein